MPQMEPPTPLAGGIGAGIRHAEQLSITRINLQRLATRRLRRQQLAIAVIPKNKTEEIRIELSEWNGYDLINLIRVWADARDGRADRIPTRAGIACWVALLPDIIEGLQRAERTARDAGLLR